MADMLKGPKKPSAGCGTAQHGTVQAARAAIAKDCPASAIWRFPRDLIGNLKE